MKRVIIVGSPRSNGRSAHLAEMLFEANIDERPEDELFLVPVSEIEVGPCIGCGACRRKSEVVFKDDAGNEVSEMRNRCVFDDDMQTLYDLLDEADELTVVSPVYFSGAPAPMKCILDRLQPYFWASREVELEERLASKRPATLHVLGEGGDPHGFDALVSEVRSATAVAGFRLERVLSWIGKIDADGEILAEPEPVEGSLGPHGREAEGEQPDVSGSGQAGRGTRAKLDLSASRPGSRQGATQAKGPAKAKGQARGQAKGQARSQGKAGGQGQGQGKGRGSGKAKGGAGQRVKGERRG